MGAAVCAGCFVFDDRHLPDTNASDASLEAAREAGPLGAVSFESKSFASSDRNTIDLPVPANAKVGDVFIAAFLVDTAGSTADAAGWTRLSDCKQSERDYHAFFFFRVADGTEKDKFSFAITSSHLSTTGVLTNYRGVDTTRIHGECAARSPASSFASDALTLESVPSTVVMTFTNDIGCNPWGSSSTLKERVVSDDRLIFSGDVEATTKNVPATTVECDAKNGAAVVNTVALYAK